MSHIIRQGRFGEADLSPLLNSKAAPTVIQQPLIGSARVAVAPFPHTTSICCRPSHVTMRKANMSEAPVISFSVARHHLLGFAVSVDETSDADPYVIRHNYSSSSDC